MRTSRTNNRHKWLNAYRIGTSVVLLIILVGIGMLFVRRAQPVTVTYAATQQSKVERAASLLQSVGFNDPSYLGITSGSEGEYPTFQVVAIGGKLVKLWIRTTPNGGLEIQPVGVYESVASADGFARLACEAVSKWKSIPQLGIKPSKGGLYGEYEDRKYYNNLLASYCPSSVYWDSSRDETAGWPRK